MAPKGYQHRAGKAAHGHVAQTTKGALREASKPAQRIYDKLRGIMCEMGVEPSA